MLIALETPGIFGSNFEYLCILILSINLYAKRWRGFTKHQFGRSSSFSENAHNSWTAWYIWFKFCILMYFNIVQPLVCNPVTWLHRASFWPVKLFFENAYNSWTAWCIWFKFVYLCILTLSSEWYAKRWRGFTEHYNHCVSPSVCPSVRPSTVSENAYNSWTAWKFLIQFCILTRHWYAKWRWGFTKHRCGRSWLVSENAHNSWTIWYILSNIAHLSIITLSVHWYAKRWWGFAKH